MSCPNCKCNFSSNNLDNSDILECYQCNTLYSEKLIHEDQLPKMTISQYEKWFNTSTVTGAVRMGKLNLTVDSK